MSRRIFGVYRYSASKDLGLFNDNVELNLLNELCRAVIASNFTSKLSNGKVWLSINKQKTEQRNEKRILVFLIQVAVEMIFPNV